MPELIVLGTAASVPDAHHDTVALALRGPNWAVLVDCGGSPLYKLAQSGVDPEDIHAVILTHRHADHIYGLPVLVQGLWLSGREDLLPIFGPAEALEAGRRMLEILDLDQREGMFAIEWHPVPLRQNRRVLEVGGVCITSTPVCHGDRETLSLRFQTSTGKAIVYSADTEPCLALTLLAAGADLLLHEATGNHAGHSSPAQAAEVAREAGVAELILIHYPVRGVNLEAWRRGAAEFPGQVTLARDGDVYPF